MAGNRVNVDLDLNVQGYTQGMNQAIESTKQYESETRKVADATGNFRKEFSQAKKDVLNLATAYRSLTDEEKKSPFGKELAKQLNDAKQKAAKYLDIQSDIQQELKNLASDTSTFDSLAQGMNVFMQTASAAAGALATLTGDENDAKRAVVMFTTAQSTLNAVTQIQNALQGQSALMLGVTRVQTLAATAAEKLSTAAKSKNIVVTKLATAAQAAFNKVAMMNPYVLLATAIIAVGTALLSFITLTHKAADEEEAEQRIAEKSKNVQEAYYNALNNSLEATIPKFIKLQEQWKMLRTEAEKIKWIKDNQKEFDNLHLSIKNVNDAENILITNSDAVMDAFIKRAEAAAVAAQATEIYKQALEDLEWIEKHRNDNSITDAELEEHGLDRESAGAKRDHGGGLMGLGRDRLTIDAEKAKINRMKNAKNEIRKLYMQEAEILKEGEEELAKAGVKGIQDGNKKIKKAIDYEKDSLADLEAQYNKEQQKLKKMNLSPEDVKKSLKIIDDLEKKIKEKKIELGLAQPDPKDVKGTLAWWQDILKQLEAKKAMLSIDDVEAQEEIDNLIDKVKTKIKLATEDLEVTGRKGIGDALLGNIKKNIPAIEKAINDLKERISQEQDWTNPTISVQKYYDKIRELEKELRILKGAQEELASGKSPFDHMMEDTAKAFEGIHAIDSVISSFSNLTDVLEGNGNAWEKFMAILSTVESVLTTINTLQAIYNALTEQAEIRKTAEAMATGGAAAAAEAKAVAEESAIPAAEAAAVANKSLEASVLDLAAAQIFAAHASIPFAGVGLASGFVTTMLGAMTTAKATIKSMQAFAEGGIVQGSSYSGDQTLIRVNAGEMILNSRQQKNLFDLLDSGAMPNANGVNVQVTGVIKGTDIILVQKNTNKVLRKTGNNISF